MTITLEISPETQRKLEAIATRNGKDVVGFVNDLIEKTVQSSPEPSSLSFDAIAAPLRQDYRESGLTEDNFDDLVEELCNEIWQESHAGAKKS